MRHRLKRRHSLKSPQRGSRVAPPLQGGILISLLPEAIAITSHLHFSGKIANHELAI
jgi:hypothetical protein